MSDACAQTLLLLRLTAKGKRFAAVCGVEDDVGQQRVGFQKPGLGNATSVVAGGSNIPRAGLVVVSDR